MFKNYKICIVGLGYVGLPLAISLSKYFQVVGYDKDHSRISQLRRGNDMTKEINNKFLKKSKIFFTNTEKNIKACNIYIVTVPTPVDKKNKPELSSIIKATKTVARHIGKNNLIIYESTVYPGCTDEILIPLIQKDTGLKLNKDFFVGYSPERIDPGLSKYKLVNQTKVISGSNKKACEILHYIYGKIIKKKLHETKNIKIAEAAKIIENTQRDINIAFVNELSMLFHKLNINTKEVLSAANTKWNFLNFVPGLVGGHCIGVDPYYLKYKAIKSGLKPNMISSGRKVNDSIPKFIFKETSKILKSKRKKLYGNKILFLGITFKENCNDFRNSKALDLFKFFKYKNKIIDVYDPVVNKESLYDMHKIKTSKKLRKKFYDLIVVSVPHKKIKKFSIKFLRSLCKENSVIIDIKSLYPKKLVEWQL
jgi:UDP-N-acetyl-D-galactosamine dehydrogenase